MDGETKIEVTALIDFRHNGGLWEAGFSCFIQEEHACLLHDAGFVRFANPENAKPVPDSGVVNIKPKDGSLLSTSTEK